MGVSERICDSQPALTAAPTPAPFPNSPAVTAGTSSDHLVRNRNERTQTHTRYIHYELRQDLARKCGLGLVAFDGAGRSANVARRCTDRSPAGRDNPSSVPGGRSPHAGIWRRLHARLHQLLRTLPAAGIFMAGCDAPDRIERAHSSDVSTHWWGRTDSALPDTRRVHCASSTASHGRLAGTSRIVG